MPEVIQLITLLLIITVSVVVMRVGAAALTETGISYDAAIFQAQSAFMGVGFTTSEAESVVSHPVRRRIIRGLMLLGFVAITSTLGTLVVTFASSSSEEMAAGTKALLLGGGLVALWITIRLKPLEPLIDRAIAYSLERWTELQIIDYEGLLNLNKGYSVFTLPVHEDSWMAGKSLREMALANEGILILSITRENGFVIGTPASRTLLQPGDRLLIYGIENSADRLRERGCGSEGDEEHDLACRRQRLRLVEERTEDEIAETEAEREPDQTTESA
ncbi:MAG: TrkA C-terminal domain-containing protein [Planctomycetota bacterium]